MAVNGILLGASSNTSLVIDGTKLTSAKVINSALTSIGEAIGKKEIVFYNGSLYFNLSYYQKNTRAIFSCISDEKIYICSLEADAMFAVDYRLDLIPNQTSITLSSTGWTANGDVYTQSATVSGVSAIETEQEIHITPAIASMDTYMEAGVYASAQATNQITFTASKVPTANLTVYTLIKKVVM